MSNWDKRYRATDTLPLLPFYRCNVCGSIVIDRKLHDAWHASINAVATEVYGIDTEID